MADLFSTINEIVGFGLKIKSTLENARHNAEDCRRISDLLDVLSAIAKHLQGSPKIMEDDSMTDTAEGLGKALQRASEFITECEGTGFLRRAFNANGIAEKLRGVCLDLLLNMSAVLLANGALNNSVLAKLEENVAQLRTDVTYTNSMLATILQIVAARPDVHLPEEVAKLVKDYQISSQNKRPEVKIQKNKKLGGSTVVPHASLPDGLAESASAPTIIINKAQSVGVSAAPLFHPQEIISISKEPGETGGYKIYTRSSETSKRLEVYPQRLLFPLEPKNEETTRWPVTLTNKTNHSVGIWIKPINEQFTKPEIMEPHSTLVVYATMKMHAQPPKDTVEFEVLMIIVQSKGDHGKLEPFIVDKLNMDSGFMVHVKNLKAEVYRAMLTAITCDPASCQIISRSIKNMTLVTSIDAHPTKPRIVTGHEGGNFSIWDYQKQETVELQVNKVGNIKTSSLKTTLRGPFVMADYFFTRGHEHLMVTLRSESHNSEIWDLKTQEVVHTLSVSGHKMTWVACHPKLPILVTMLDDGTVCLWDASSYRLEKMVHITNSKCCDLVFVPDTNGPPRLVVAFETMIAIMEVNLPIASGLITGTN